MISFEFRNDARPDAGPARPGTIGQDEIHLWTAGLDAAAFSNKRLSLLLSADETARAAKLIFDKDREAFIFGRAILRIILGIYLGLEPRRVALIYGPNGKPGIAGGPSFNISGSDGRFVCALTISRPIGVDIERIRAVADMDGIAGRFFSEGEREALRSAPGFGKAALFFRFWTRKEAVVKGLGRGLTLPLDLVDVSGPEGPEGRRVKFSGRAAEAAGPEAWTVRDLEGPDGFAAALAIECPRVGFIISREFFLPIAEEADGEGA